MQDRQGLAEAAGLKAAIIDIESHASRLAASRLMEAFPNKGVDTMVALFEVGALTTSMQVIRNDEVLYDRDQALAVRSCPSSSCGNTGFCGRGGKQETQWGPAGRLLTAVLRPFVESLSQEIGRALQFFHILHTIGSTTHHACRQGRPLPGFD